MRKHTHSALADLHQEKDILTEAIKSLIEAMNATRRLTHSRLLDQDYLEALNALQFKERKMQADIYLASFLLRVENENTT